MNNCYNYNSSVVNNRNWLLYEKNKFIGKYILVAAVTNYQKLDGLKQYRFILSQPWRLDVQSQGVLRATLPLEALGENHLLASF